MTNLGLFDSPFPGCFGSIVDGKYVVSIDPYGIDSISHTSNGQGIWT